MDQHTKTGNQRKNKNTQKTWKSDFKNDLFAKQKSSALSDESWEKSDN